MFYPNENRCKDCYKIYFQATHNARKVNQKDFEGLYQREIDKYL